MSDALRTRTAVVAAESVGGGDARNRLIAETCFYCGGLLTAATLERDHFPIPAHLGGVRTVPACRTCHDMKDRFSLNRFTDAMIAEVVDDMPYLGRSSRILFARLIRLALEARDVHMDGDLRDADGDAPYA